MQTCLDYELEASREPAPINKAEELELILKLSEKARIPPPKGVGVEYFGKPIPIEDLGAEAVGESEICNGTADLTESGVSKAEADFLDGQTKDKQFRGDLEEKLTTQLEFEKILSRQEEEQDIAWAKLASAKEYAEGKIWKAIMEENEAHHGSSVDFEQELKKLDAKSAKISWKSDLGYLHDEMDRYTCRNQEYATKRRRFLKNVAGKLTKLSEKRTEEFQKAKADRIYTKNVNLAEIIDEMIKTGSDAELVQNMKMMKLFFIKLGIEEVFKEHGVIFSASVKVTTATGDNSKVAGVLSESSDPEATVAVEEALREAAVIMKTTTAEAGQTTEDYVRI